MKPCPPATPSRPGIRLATRLIGLTVMVLVMAGLTVSPAAADTYVPISGAGSTWSSNAIDAWRANVKQFGMTVNYQASGSSDGRNQFANNTVDFGVSEIPYGRVDNGRRDNPPARKFAYMPIVAGGTSFMYNLKIGNTQVTNLRLSGENVAKIFTGVITQWSDPAIKKDNPALALPARKIVPVVRSDGSGTSAQFTLWMSKQYPAIWNAYCKKAGRSGTACGETSNYPVVPGSGFTAQNGSLGVSGYVAQKTSVGAITYVEYSYPLNQNFPVVKLLNKSGYYTLPTANNVAVGLLKATINADLSQNLDGVYANADRRAYPLSSYSYMIIPTKVEGSFSTAKGNTLGAFAYYFLCEGQRQAPDLGYSPLPINLVKAGLKQVNKIPGRSAQSIDLKKCNNPTFSADGSNTLARTAPYPPACDKQGNVQCTSNGSTAAGGSTSGNGRGGNGTGGAAGPGGRAGAGAGTTAGAGAGGVVDPDTGQVAGAGTDSSGGTVSAVPVALNSDYADTSLRRSLVALALLLLVGTVVGPPLLSKALARERDR